MVPYALPEWAGRCSWAGNGVASLTDKHAQEIRRGLQNFNVTHPLVSVVIPVWNEEKTVAHTLFSLSKMTPGVPTEVIIVNNNSTDGTQVILDRCGARSILEQRQGVAFARQAGLAAARGTFLLTGDGDSLYPPTWVDAMVKILQRPGVALVWGAHSFLPDDNHPRLPFFFYELMKQGLYKLRQWKRAHLNAMGANIGFRREWALSVGGYDTSLRHGEDGKLAYELRSLGSLVGTTSRGARVWTSARRFEEDRSLSHSFARRLRKELPRMAEYLISRAT